MKVLANAKLNLDLSITGNCGGYHMIRSTVVTVDISDVITVTVRGDNSVTVSGMPHVQCTHNIAYKTATKIIERFGTPGVDIVIDKGIPYMSGMGGSSADGAGVIVAMCQLFNMSTADVRILDIASSLGSDITYLVSGGCAVISGKGDIIESLPYVERHFVVTTFDTKLNTAQIYQLYDSSPIVCCDNALQGVVEQHYDFMNDYKCFVSKLGYTSRMTGSGSAYFVQCDSSHEASLLSKQLCEAGFSSMSCASTRCGVEVQ